MTIRSNSGNARRTMSSWPTVNGSKLPVNIPVFMSFRSLRNYSGGKVSTFFKAGDRIFNAKTQRRKVFIGFGWDDKYVATINLYIEHSNFAVSKRKVSTRSRNLLKNFDSPGQVLTFVV